MQTRQQLVEGGKHKGVGVPPDGLLPLPREVTIGGGDQVKEDTRGRSHGTDVCTHYSIVHGTVRQIHCTL